MNYFTQVPADILCTIIAMGFLSSNSKIPVVCATQASLDAHMQLKGLLPADFPFNPTLAQPKKEQPLIVGQTGYIFDKPALQAIADDFQTGINKLHEQFEVQKGGPMPGAYIGGKADTSTLRLNSPSALHLYEPVYRASDDSKVGPAYQLAQSVTNGAIKFLLGVKETTTKGLKIVPDRSALESHLAPDFLEGHLFGSCHGMILALNDYRRYLAKTEVCIELALGRDTMKVASCLPCSLFMAANRFPPSAMHLGCGDNWCPPMKSVDTELTTNWRNAVIDAYRIGLGQLKGPKTAAFETYLNSTDRKRLSTNPDEEIPALFLEALTFERSFIERMTCTLR